MTAIASEPRDQFTRAYLAGIGLILLAALLWSLNGALIKVINQGGAGPKGVTIAFGRSVFAGLLLLPFATGGLRAIAKRPAFPHGRSAPSPSMVRARKPASRLSVLLCVVCFALMTTTFVVANTMTAAANAIILQYTSTFWVFGLSPWLLGERASALELWILGLALIGIGIIFAGSVHSDLPGLLIALAAGLFYGLLTMMLRHVRDFDSAGITVLNNLGTALLLTPAVLIFGSLALPARTWLLLAFMGVVQFGLPYYFFSLGLGRVPAHHAALLTMAEPILVPIWTYFVIGEVPPRMTILGGILILAALTLFVALRSVRGSAQVCATRPPESTIDIRPSTISEG